MKILVVASLLACSVAPARAEPSVEPYQPNLSGQNVECAAFQHDADGSWTTLKDLPVQRLNEFTTIAAGTNIRPGGQPIAGLDVGGMLDEVCPH